MTNETKTVRHRDGTTTTWERIALPLSEVARRLAIWRRVAPVGKRDAEGIDYALEREPRGFLHVDGTPAFVTRLRVRFGGREAVATKTQIGEYFRARIDRLDEDGAEFWQDRDAPNRWILADVFAI